METYKLSQLNYFIYPFHQQKDIRETNCLKSQLSFWMQLSDTKKLQSQPRQLLYALIHVSFKPLHQQWRQKIKGHASYDLTSETMSYFFISYHCIVYITFAVYSYPSFSQLWVSNQRGFFRKKHKIKNYKTKLVKT